MTHDDRFELAPVAPEFFVRDVDAAIAFYSDVFGYTLLRKEASPEGGSSFAIGHIAGATIMFMDERWYTGTRGELDRRGTGVDIRIMVPDVDAVYQRVREAELKVLHDIGDRDYGLRDFIVRDPNGFRLRFASPLS